MPKNLPLNETKRFFAAPRMTIFYCFNDIGLPASFCFAVINADITGFNP